MAPGVWKASLGQPEDLSLLSAAGVQPALTRLASLPAAAFPLDAAEIEVRQMDWKVALRLPLAANEDIYGLGVDFSTVRRNGQIFELHVDHWNRRAPTPGRTHAPVPLYISSRGFAVLFDSARYLKVSVGHGVRLAAKQKPPVVDRTTRTIRPATPGTAPIPAPWISALPSDSIEVLANAPGFDVYVFAGPSPMDALRRYNLFCGGGSLPPKWGLGFLTRLPTKATAADVLADVAAFREHGLPLDMIGLEPGWMSHAYPCSLEWDPTRFPDPAGLLGELDRLGVRANLWFNPYIGPPHGKLYGRMLPFAGSHLVWNGLVPDYTLPEARATLAGHLRDEVLRLHPRAVGGFKVDEVDGYDRYLWPETATFPSGHHAEQLRQTYGLLVQRVLLEEFRALDRRTFGQVRGTNAGASSFPFVIYNDNYDFGEYITAVVNSGFAGVLWSPEVRGSDNPEDMLRRIQAVCLSPLALYNGWASPQKLWTHPSALPGIRAALRLRLQLLPYLYHTFAQYHLDGLPVIRPLQLVTSAAATTAGPGGQPALDATTNPYEAPAALKEIKDQYLLGDSLLVALLAPDAASRPVVLPPGRWYDFYTGRLAGEDTTIYVTPPADQLPLFVRDGAIIPRLAGEPLRAPRTGELPRLELWHYGEKPGALRLYDDDGETFAYERGNVSWTDLRAERSPDGTWHGTAITVAGTQTWSYSDPRWFFITP
ncbi:TIM-barrel domain-containing protein [Oleiharenicola lentus]|uniref:glycoside hydrolase family 31 protein n=1 Tax=Oleiharenicola lentus TaxID=2508720 RepID=UPI0013E946AA|nr:TIM-barrel domain-containing protein [Oleiharenicola lentus]